MPPNIKKPSNFCQMIKFNSKKSILAKGGYSRMSTLKNPFVKKIDLKGQNVKNMVKHSVRYI